MTDDVWTIKAALEWTVGYLERKGDENPRLSAEWLLSEATALRRIELYTNFERPLSLDERDLLRGYVTRRGKGEPLQYITGEVGFRHIAVKVRPGVLIPRPETEVLVSEALALLPPACRPRATDSRMTDAEAEALLAAAQGEEGPAPGAPEPDAPEPDALEPDAPEHLLVADLCTGCLLYTSCCRKPTRWRSRSTRTTCASTCTAPAAPAASA